jgi:hypothetical protein
MTAQEIIDTFCYIDTSEIKCILIDAWVADTGKSCEFQPHNLRLCVTNNNKVVLNNTQMVIVLYNNGTYFTLSKNNTTNLSLSTLAATKEV